MSRKVRGLGLVTLLALMLHAGTAQAQTAETANKPAIPPRYDISKEVTLNATVESVPSKLTPGQAKSRFVLQTNLGKVQGSLTPFVLRGNGALSINPGQHIQVTGVMTTMKNEQQVLVIRTIEIGGRTYAIRNERGFPLEHPALNSSATTQSKGGQL